MKGKIDILWLSLDRVENKYSSTSFSLAKELAKNNRVFFIDNPLTIYEFFKLGFRKLRSPGKSVIPASTGMKLPDSFIPIPAVVTWPINWIPQGWLYSKFSALNNLIFKNALSRLLRKHNIEKYIFVNLFNPFYGLTFPKVAPLLSVYYSVDDIRYSPYVFKHGPALEEKVVKSYDLTLVTSQQLQNILQKFSLHVFYLPNAADIKLFNTAVSEVFDRPDSVRNALSPIVIYTGHIDWRMDIDLICEVARQHPDKLFLFVGPVSLNQESQKQISTIENAIFTGSRKIEDLPQFLQHAKCAIIPFKCNTLTKSIYPLKINEYLAAGLPVVATPFSEDMQQFGDVIALESSPDNFANSIHTAIQTNSEELTKKRLQAAENNSWTARANQFWDILNEFMKK